jgi:hypothetical protein
VRSSSDHTKKFEDHWKPSALKQSFRRITIQSLNTCQDEIP